MILTCCGALGRPWKQALGAWAACQNPFGNGLQSTQKMKKIIKIGELLMFVGQSQCSYFVFINISAVHTCLEYPGAVCIRLYN